MAECSELQRDLLELILEKLDLADHARFASVCSWWRSVAIDNPPIHKPLYMAHSHDPENLLRRFITSFIPNSWKDATFIGASDGWLVIIIDRGLFLLNKGFNSIIPLPSPPTPEDFFVSPRHSKAVLSSPPSSPSGEGTVVVYKHDFRNLYYCRLGSDESFINLLDTSKTSSYIKDILFYKGRLYVLCNHSTIRIFDNFHNKVTQLVANFDDGLLRSDHNLYQLLISRNTLLMATMWNHWNGLPLLFKFEQDKYSRVVQVSNINDNCLLFINGTFSVSVTSDEHKEFRLYEYTPPPCSPFFKPNTYVLDMRKDTYEVKVGDPCQLYFSMFQIGGINNEASNGP